MIKMGILKLILNFLKKNIEKTGEASNDEIREIFNNLNKKKDVINLTPLRVHTIDEKYNLSNVDNLKDFLNKDYTNFGIFQKEKNDCDDFAIKLWSRFKKHNPNFALGFAMSPSHAFNVFIDDKLKIWIVEPQNDKIFEYKKQSKYKLTMVII